MTKKGKAIPASTARTWAEDKQFIQTHDFLIQKFDLEASAVYGVVESLCLNSEAKSFTGSAGWIAQRIKKSSKQVRRKLAQLTDAGFLVAEFRDGKPTKYTLPKAQTLGDLTLDSQSRVLSTLDSQSRVSGLGVQGARTGSPGSSLALKKKKENIKEREEEEIKANSSINEEEESTTTKRGSAKVGASVVVVAQPENLKDIFRGVKSEKGIDAKTLLFSWGYKASSFYEGVIAEVGQKLAPIAAVKILTQIERGIAAGKIKDPGGFISGAFSGGYILALDYPKIKPDADSEEARRAYLKGWEDQ